MVIDQSISSKTGTLRSLLIRAWRERWSDLQWGIHIKTVLPRYISGDIYHLSDCILQQALMGPLPNNLILSYLRHSLYSQVVSYGGVLESISKYDGFRKLHCVHALLNLMQSMMKSVSCKGKPEDCLMLATSLVGAINWLIQVMCWSIQQLNDLSKAPEHSTNLNLAGSILMEVVGNPFLMCMLDIGRWEDKGLWNEVTKKITEVEALLASASAEIDNKDILATTVREVRDTSPLAEIRSETVYDCTQTPLSYALHSLVLLEVNLHSSRDSSKFAHQLIQLKNLKGMSTTELYIQLLYCCFLGLSCKEDLPLQQLKWVGFTFIKIPTIIFTIHTTLEGDSSPCSEYLLSALNSLSTMTPALDMADSAVNCNCLEFLLFELTRKKLLLETDASILLNIRMKESMVLSSLQTPEGMSGNFINPAIVLRALETAEGIFNDLNTKLPDAVLPVMGHLLNKRSRDLLVTAVAASGSLQAFTQKIISLNEQSLDPQPSETTQMATNRALMFDYSFLLLCYITQVWGPEVVISDNCDTFIEQWLRDTLPEGGKAKNNPHSTSPTDTMAIERFMQQVNTESESKYVNTRWGEICETAMAAFKEVLNAAVYAELSEDFIKNLINNLSQYLCCLPISITSWLCAHMHVVSGEQAEFVSKCLQHIEMIAQDQSGALDNFKDRVSLMGVIISNMIRSSKSDVQLLLERMENKKSFSIKPISLNENNKENHPLLSQVLNEIWTDITQTSGILTHKTLNTCKYLLKLGGTRMFVNNFVKVAMESIFLNDLNKSVDMIFGLFHHDINGCTFHFLIHTLPLYINGSLSSELVCQGRITALAHLTLMLVTAAWLNVKNNADTSTPMMPHMGRTPSRKRPYHNRELDELENKLLSQAAELNLDSSSYGMEGTSILVAVHSLFQLMMQVSRSGVVSPVTHLIVSILHEFVSSPNTHTILKLLPSPLLSNIIPLLSPSINFSFPQLLALSAPRLPSDSVGILDMMPTQTNAQQAASRRSAAKLLCIARNLELSNIE